jgi:Protein of unknown function (DUF3775)
MTMKMTLDARAFADLKRRAHLMAPQIPSSKLAEILSSGLGYGTHAALRSDMARAGWIERKPDDAKAAQRAAALGIVAPAGLMASLEAREPDGPVSLTAADVRDIIYLAEACNRESAGKMRDLDGSGVYTFSQLAKVGLLERTDAEEAVESRIGALKKPALLELMALVWIGRERVAVNADHWRAHLANARRIHNEGSVSYIAEKSPALPKYLAAGMRLIPGIL